MQALPLIYFFGLYAVRECIYTDNRKAASVRPKKCKISPTWLTSAMGRQQHVNAGCLKNSGPVVRIST